MLHTATAALPERWACSLDLVCARGWISAGCRWVSLVVGLGDSKQ
jgi:hypothetical protein